VRGRNNRWRNDGEVRLRRSNDTFINCHPERSEGSAISSGLQIPRFARDDKIWGC
jgi:hypothetical protein